MIRLIFALTPGVIALFSIPAAAQESWPVYTDGLQNGWQPWGWAKAVAYDNAEPVHAGQMSVAVTLGPWEGTIMHHAAFDTSPWDALSFWMRSNADNGAAIRLHLREVPDKVVEPGYVLPPVVPGQWTHVVVPLEKFGAARQANVEGFMLVNGTDKTLAPFQLDDIEFVKVPAAPVNAGGNNGGAAGVGAGDGTIYDDATQNGWAPWGWAKECTYGNTSPVRTGTKSIAVKLGGYEALYLHHTEFDTAAFSTLTFYVQSTSEQQDTIKVVGLHQDKASGPTFELPLLEPGAWTKITVPLAKIGLDNSVDATGIFLQNGSDKPVSTLYLDDIRLQR